MRTAIAWPGVDAADGFQLVQRARVQAHAAADVLGQPRRRHLRAELDLRRGVSGAQRALDLPVAGGVDVQAEIAEEVQDAPARVGLHRVPDSEAVRRAEAEQLARSGLQRGRIIDVARRAEALAHARGLLRGQQGHERSVLSSMRRRGRVSSVRPTREY
jgi:hypothetical protein